MQKDVERHNPPELDAIAGPILRGAQKHWIEVPATKKLVAAVEQRAGLTNSTGVRSGSKKNSRSNVLNLLNQSLGGVTIRVNLAKSITLKGLWVKIFAISGLEIIHRFTNSFRINGKCTKLLITKSVWSALPFHSLRLSKSC